MYDQNNEIRLRPISQAILKYLIDNTGPIDAESIWLDIKAQGAPFSIGSVYGHLNKMVLAGIITKMPGTNKKAMYQFNSQTSTITL